MLLIIHSGALTFFMAHEAIATNRFNYRLAVLTKWLRYMPSIAALVALDLLWPLFGDGPIYSQLSEFILNKCSKNWWKNLLFISNHDPALDNVSLMHRY